MFHRQRKVADAMYRYVDRSSMLQQVERCTADHHGPALGGPSSCVMGKGGGFMERGLLRGEEQHRQINPSCKVADIALPWKAGRASISNQRPGSSAASNQGADPRGMFNAAAIHGVRPLH